VGNPFTALKPLRLPFGREAEPVVPYDVLCPCGGAVRGVRQKRRLVVPCPSCGRPVFVLARSPLPSPERPAAAQARGKGRAWLWPLLAAVATLLIVAAVFVAAAPYLSRPATVTDPPDDVRGEVLKHIAAGRQAIDEGNFHLALQELNAAAARTSRKADALFPAERRDLAQLRRQSDLLSRLLSRSLQEIVQEAALTRKDEEWRARFQADYQGKSVVFDDVVRRDGLGRPELGVYEIRVGMEVARPALEDLKALQNVPLERPKRLLFGAQLAGVEREQGGAWVIRFDPDSGVLLTDRGAAAACCSGPPDRDLLDLLQRQEEWVK
jgi:hypothetical protein